MNARVPIRRTSIVRFIGVYIIGVLSVGLFSLVPAQALPYGIGSYGTCEFGSCSITLTSSTTISANITPSGSTTCTVVKDTVSVRTGSSTGYTLQVNDADADTKLNRSGSGSINPTSGTRAAPTVLTANSWGYRVDGFAGFGAGPTSAVSNASIPSLQFAGMPALDSSDIIASKASAASVAEITPVWYGVCSDTTIPAGAYTDTVIYTALTN